MWNSELSREVKWKGLKIFADVSCNGYMMLQTWESCKIQSENVFKIGAWKKWCHTWTLSKQFKTGKTVDEKRGMMSVKGRLWTHCTFLSHVSKYLPEHRLKTIKLVNICVRYRKIRFTWIYRPLDWRAQKNLKNFRFCLMLFLFFFSLGGGSGQHLSDQHALVWSWQNIMSFRTLQALTLSTNDWLYGIATFKVNPVQTITSVIALFVASCGWLSRGEDMSSGNSKEFARNTTGTHFELPERGRIL